MAVSARLKAVAELVPACGTVADIGCDHGKLAVALVQSGRARRAICGDISPGSLEKARKLVAQCGLEGTVSLRQGNGLGVLETGEADTAVIAGMGGLLISKILEEGADKAPRTLVLSPNRDAALLRRYVTAHGCCIVDETLVFENRHYYTVIRAERGESPALSDMELEFGPVLLKKKPEILKQYLKRCIARLQAIQHRLERADSPGKLQLLNDIEEKLRRYAEVERCL